jgi:hypothetical protein
MCEKERKWRSKKTVRSEQKGLQKSHVNVNTGMVIHGVVIYMINDRLA